MAFVLIMVKCGFCYDKYFGVEWQTWEDTFSWGYDVIGVDEEEFPLLPYVVYSLFIIICSGIITLSFLSIYFSFEFQNKMC